MTGAALLCTRERTARVTNVELFFDLVYVFAVTQLSHYLLDHRNVAGALQARLPALGLGLCAAVVVLAVAALDYRASHGR